MSKSAEQSIYDRALEAASDHHGRPATQTEMAKLAGVKQPSVTKWRVGGMDLKTAAEFSKNTKVAVEWLLTGRGSKLVADTVPADMKELVRLWVHMSDQVKRDVIGYAKIQRAMDMTGNPERREAFESQIPRPADRVHEDDPPKYEDDQ